MQAVSQLAQPPGLDPLGVGVGDPLPGSVGDVLVDGDGVAPTVADPERLGVTVGDGLAVGVAVGVADADGCGRVGVGVGVGVGIVVDVDAPEVPVEAGG